MIKRTSAPSSNTAAARAVHLVCRTAGFTLVELLVVLGIIVLLIGLLTPMISRAYRNAERARVAGDIQNIASALEAYKQDHGQYPDPGTNGAHALCMALIGPGPAGPGPGADGADGSGFRVRPGGRVWPPYLPPDKFRMNDGDADLSDPLDPAQAMIIDKFRKPFLYYLTLGHTNIQRTNGYIAVPTGTTKPLYNPNQNLDPSGNQLLPMQGMRMMLGDMNNNGGIDAGETAKFTGPYILWSAGPDENYGPQAGDAEAYNTLDAADLKRCDDLTNFRS